MLAIEASMQFPGPLRHHGACALVCRRPKRPNARQANLAFLGPAASFAAGSSWLASELFVLLVAFSICRAPCRPVACTSSLPQQSALVAAMRLLHCCCCCGCCCCTDALAPTTSTTRQQLHLSLADAKSCTDAPTTSTTRRRLLLSTAPFARTCQPALAADTPAESVRKAASNCPGLGPPDVLFPAAAAGAMEGATDGRRSHWSC